MNSPAAASDYNRTGSTAPPGLPFDSKRGSAAMWLFIVTEAALFVVLFFSYFYLGYDKPRWPPEAPPKIRLALVMVVVLLGGSVVLQIGEMVRRREQDALARLAVGATLLIGAVFLTLFALEHREHLKSLTPYTDAYGSIFYTITLVHGAHVLLGMAMLAYVLVLPGLSENRMPQRPLHNAALYWHFVALLEVIIVYTLYLLPQ